MIHFPQLCQELSCVYGEKLDSSPPKYKLPVICCGEKNLEIISSPLATQAGLQPFGRFCETSGLSLLIGQYNT